MSTLIPDVIFGALKPAEEAISQEAAALRPKHLTRYLAVMEALTKLCEDSWAELNTNLSLGTAVPDARNFASKLSGNVEACLRLLGKLEQPDNLQGMSEEQRASLVSLKTRVSAVGDQITHLFRWFEASELSDAAKATLTQKATANAQGPFLDSETVLRMLTDDGAV